MTFSQLHQFFRHPLAHALTGRLFNAGSAIVPVVSVAFRSALLFVGFRLFQTQNDSVNNFLPVLELDAASNNGKSR